MLSLIGPNGAGKTSAFNAITGYLRAGRRRRLLPRPPAHRAAAACDRRARRRAHLPEDQPVRRRERARQRARSACTCARVSGRSPSCSACLRSRAMSGRGGPRRGTSCGSWRSEARAGELGASLPYGEQRLLEVAIALAARPKLLLLDEPVSGMNPAEKARFMGTLAKIRERGDHGAPGRARHAHGHGRFRPRHLPQPGPHHRQRLARGRSRRTPT